jgi:hypothetical protein
MKYLAIILLLFPAFVYADVLPTRTLTPVVRIADDIIYVTDKKGFVWSIATRCEIEGREVREFTVRSRHIKQGTLIKLNEDKHCEVETIEAA